jgi:replicative DNA helicase
MTSQSAYSDETDGWGPLVLPEQFEASPLPLGLLPPVLGEYARTVGEYVQCDPSIPAVLGLGAVAALAQKTATVAGWTWQESLSLFLIAVAPSGERKSPAYKAMCGPLRAIEAEFDREGRDGRMYANERRALLTSQLATMRKQLASGKGDGLHLEDVAEVASELEAMGPDELPPRLIADNVTPEALTSLMARNGGRMAVLSPEGAFLSILKGQYTGNGEPADLSAMLQAYNVAESITVDRKGRESERIEYPSLSMVLIGQPLVFEELCRLKGARERGLIGRFIVVQVPPRAGTRFRSITGGAQVEPPETAQGQRYEGLLRALSLRKPVDSPPVLRLSPEAAEHYEGWHDELESERDPDSGQWALIPEFANKAHGLALRFAGLFHLCEHPGAGDGDLIGIEDLKAACELTDWALESHKAAAVGLSVPEEIKRVQRLLGLARRGTLAQSRKDRGPWAPFTLRDIRRGLGNSSNPVGNPEAEDTAGVLVDLGLARFSKVWGAYVWHPELVAGGAR